MRIEGGYAIEDSPEVLRAFHRLGVRYMTLTHTAPTSWAGAASTGPGTGRHSRRTGHEFTVGSAA
jgi:membrane dipeptidase